MKDNQKELFVVVDENDNVIGYRSRFECHHDKSLIHRAVSVALFNPKGLLLLQKRSAEKDTYPGYYTLSASGHLNKGDTYESAAHREVYEELGVKGLQLEYVGKQLVRMEQETEICAVYRGICEGPFNVAADEVETVGFYPVEEVIKMDNLTPSAKIDLKVMGIV